MLNLVVVGCALAPGGNRNLVLGGGVGLICVWAFPPAAALSMGPGDLMHPIRCQSPEISKAWGSMVYSLLGVPFLAVGLHVGDLMAFRTASSRQAVTSSQPELPISQKPPGFAPLRGPERPSSPGVTGRISEQEVP